MELFVVQRSAYGVQHALHACGDPLQMFCVCAYASRIRLMKLSNNADTQTICSSA